MIEFGGIYINPYTVSHMRIESNLEDVVLHITTASGEVVSETYKSRAEAAAMITEFSELIDPTLVLDFPDDEDDDDDGEEAQDFEW